MHRAGDSLSLAAVCFSDCCDAPGGFAGAMKCTNKGDARLLPPSAQIYNVRLREEEERPL
jgi:hypothetical protein